MSLFAQASLPIVYSSVKRETFQTINSTTINTSNFNYEIFLRGNMGLGVSLNGRCGSLEMNANTTGLFTGFHKYFGKK